MPFPRSAARLALTAALWVAIAPLAAPASWSGALADPAFDAFVSKLRPEAAKAGVSGRTFDSAYAAFSGPDIGTIEKMGRQAEFNLKIWEYLDLLVNEEQVARGRELRVRHKALLDRIEARYGVDRDVVLAVWGVESRFGAKRGDHNVIQALSTLAWKAPRRRDFWRKELVSALRILEGGHVAPTAMAGSWAGAMGHTQFMPSSWRAYAADADGDGRRDIWTNEADALASTANYLAEHGWQRGLAWGREVRIAEGLRKGGKARSFAQWAKAGVQAADGAALPAQSVKGDLKLPAGGNGPAFLVTKNFNVIKRYNNSDFYAFAVSLLSDRIGGAGDVVATWPRGYTPLSMEERKELQARLKDKGLYDDEVSGQVGPITKAAIETYQRSIGVKPDGYASMEILGRLRAR